MLNGLVNSGFINKEQIMASAKSEETIKSVKQKYSINVTNDNKEVAKFADIIILAVKPIHYGFIISEIKDLIHNDTVVVTIAAGITLQDIEDSFNKKVKCVRTMPNTPSLVGEGMSVLCPNAYISEMDLKNVEQLFNSFGRSEILEENLMDVVPAISGSSPAYVYMMIEALADGGVMKGISRKQSYQLAAQAVLGAAKMVLETAEHPGALKDDVCTPGGATIEAVAELEKNGFRGSIIQAMEKCYEKTTGMTNGRK